MWKKGNSYNAIAESYADFTVRHYGRATVVFDGYGEGPSVKDNAHQRWGKNLHPLVSFTTETVFRQKGGRFISWQKQGRHDCSHQHSTLTKRGCHVIQSPGDADVDIIKATVERSRHWATTLVGEDTDLLILLLHYCYGLPCTAVCGPCETENCDNLNNTQEVDTEEEDDT